MDAEGDVIRGLQIVEHACSVTSLQMGETMPGVTKDMDTYSIRYFQLFPVFSMLRTVFWNFPTGRRLLD